MRPEVFIEQFHRAWVRGKVTGWQKPPDFEKAKKYFDLASSYLHLLYARNDII